MRILILGVVALLCGAPYVAFAERPTKTALVEYAVGSADMPGYERATIEVAYSFLVCAGNVVMAYRLRPDTLNVFTWYRLGSIRHIHADANKPTVSSVDLHGVIKHNGSSLGYFNAGSAHGMGPGGCVGQTHVVGSVKTMIGERPSTADVDTFLDALSVQVYRTTQPLRSSALEADLNKRETERIEKIKKDNAYKKHELPPTADAEDEPKRNEAEETKSKVAEPRKTDENNSKSTTSPDASKDDARKPTANNDGVASKDDATRDTIAAPTIAPTATSDSQPKATRDRSARAKWTKADETSEGYWPTERCYWTDDHGLIHGPPGKASRAGAYIHFNWGTSPVMYQLELLALPPTQTTTNVKADIDGAGIGVYYGCAAYLKVTGLVLKSP